ETHPPGGDDGSLSAGQRSAGVPAQDRGVVAERRLTHVRRPRERRDERPHPLWTTDTSEWDGTGIPAGRVARPRATHATRHRGREPCRRGPAVAAPAVASHAPRAGCGNRGVELRDAGRSAARTLDGD